MSKINEHLSNSTESRGKKRVINYPNLSESVRLKRKRKMETKTTSPKKRRRTENEEILWRNSSKDIESFRFSFCVGKNGKVYS